MEIRWVGCWALEKGEQKLEVVFNIFDFVISKLCNSSRAVFFEGKMLNIASKMHFLYVAIFLGYLKLV